MFSTTMGTLERKELYYDSLTDIIYNGFTTPAPITDSTWIPSIEGDLCSVANAFTTYDTTPPYAPYYADIFTGGMVVPLPLPDGVDPTYVYWWCD